MLPFPNSRGERTIDRFCVQFTLEYPTDCSRANSNCKHRPEMVQNVILHYPPRVNASPHAPAELVSVERMILHYHPLQEISSFHAMSGGGLL